MEVIPHTTVTEQRENQSYNSPFPVHTWSNLKTISGFRKTCIEILIRLSIARIVIQQFRKPSKIIHILKTLDYRRRQFYGNSRVKKVVRVDGKYYWDLYIPGWRSDAFTQFFKAEINRIAPLTVPSNQFSSVFIAITKKCPLRCEHCFEWDALNGKEKLKSHDLQLLVKKFQDRGVAQVQLTGGEPMLRVSDIVTLLQTSKKSTDFWILTSGYQFTAGNAQILKQAGLTGVVISLDHFDPEMHNLFRGFKDSYKWVEEAIHNSLANDLVTAVSLCATNSFISEANLLNYLELARRLGVHFVQILEPKAVGHYAGKDVRLKTENETILKDLYFKINYDKKYRHYPIIHYPGSYHKQIGCLSAGNRNLYIDTDGDIHACPFCQSKMGSALADDMDDSIQKLQARGCHSFNNAQF